VILSYHCQQVSLWVQGHNYGQLEKKNSVFIATSLDGYIADKKGGVEWLHSIPNPDNIDMGYVGFNSQIDALVMGRTTFETVSAFDIDWPYTQPVYVLSNTLNELPQKFKDKAQLMKGTLAEILGRIHQNGHFRFYIDGGTTIQGFLKENLIDEMIITIIPVLLGGGSPLFAELTTELNFECRKSEVFLGKIVQNHFTRIRKQESS
jgi:dihydrofolate reductase